MGAGTDAGGAGFEFAKAGSQTVVASNTGTEPARSVASGFRLVGRLIEDANLEDT
ncbi:MAG: hypothetical protein L0H29_04055 [Sinobacteraceae bacterium]|nr:hypothetical protein [Nevskiaceae bacterium]